MQEKKYQVLKRQKPWREYYFYQKSEVLYHLTYIFCHRFLPLHGDRTVDQMVQAARSGKQNIIEGLEDGVTSTEMQLKLLNVARSSLQELREDYRDYLISRGFSIWTDENERFVKMKNFCRQHNKIEDYQPFFNRWTDEEMSNIALTLCYMTDSLLNKFLLTLEDDFVKKGGIKERMHSVRTNYRKQQDEEFAILKEKVKNQEQEIQKLKELLKINNIEIV